MSTAELRAKPAGAARRIGPSFGAPDDGRYGGRHAQQDAAPRPPPAPDDRRRARGRAPRPRAPALPRGPGARRRDRHRDPRPPAPHGRAPEQPRVPRDRPLRGRRHAPRRRQAEGGRAPWRHGVLDDHGPRGAGPARGRRRRRDRDAGPLAHPPDPLRMRREEGRVLREAADPDPAGVPARHRGGREARRRVPDRQSAAQRVWPPLRQGRRGGASRTHRARAERQRRGR